MNTVAVIILGIALFAFTEAGPACNTTVCATESTSVKPTMSTTRNSVNPTNRTVSSINSTQSTLLGVNATTTKKTSAENALKSRMNTIGEKCRKEISAQQEILALMNSRAIPTNEKQRCFLECVYKDLGLIKDNKLHIDGATALAKQIFADNKDKLQKADELIKKCKIEVVVDKASTERCPLGKLIRACVVNHGKDLQLFTKNN